MKIALCIIIGILLLVSAVLLLKLRQRERQLRLFTQQLKEIREQKQDRLIRVELFDGDTVELARELQAYVDEEQLLIRKAEEERQAVQTMVAGISHDFRTPLTAASGYMQMAAQDPGLSERNSLYLEKAIAKTDYLKELSDEFFALSLVESKGDEERKLLSMKRMLEDVTLSQHDWITASNTGFSADITEDSCDIYADEVDMLRLLENLYSNARKYTKSRMHICLEKKEDKSIELTFSNDSDQLSAADIGTVFEPFHRNASGDTPGSGLGLYIVKRIVEKYRGHISARINEAGDFEIRFSLPA